MPCQLPVPIATENVTDDTVSFLCTLAMEKCSKKSEKKKASCGGAAMRKRLLIKNFVAQMLAFERQSSPTHMDDDSNYDNDYDNNESDDYQMDSEDSSGMGMENLKNMDNPQLSSVLSTSPEDDVALSMVRRQNDDLYIVPGTSNEVYEEFSNKNLNERTNNSAYSSWEDYHTVPGREYSTCSSLESDDTVRNSLFSDNLFVHFSSYPQIGCTTLPDTSSLDYNLQPQRSENFFDGMSISDDGMNGDNSCVEPESECPTEFASLVNLNEPMRFLCRTEAQLYCRRSITDLDTNTTVVEEEDYGLHRSQRKRQVFAQDELSNYMFLTTTSPKRIRL